MADIHTDPNQGAVLDVAVGDANFLVAAIDNDQDRMVYGGPVFSYYEFTQPASERLTDEAWQRMLSEGRAPQRPEWTATFQGPRQRRAIER